MPPDPAPRPSAEQSLELPPEWGLRSIYMVDPTTGWGLARDGDDKPHLLRTTDGGESWSDVTPNRVAGAYRGRAAHFPDGVTGWLALGYLGPEGPRLAVLHTEDGGRRWRRTTFPAQDWEVEQLDIVFAGSRYGWILATSGPASGTMLKSVFRTEDGGHTWTRVSTDARTADGPTPGALPATGYPTGMTFRSATDGWVAYLYRTDPTIIPLYRTADGGETWQLQSIKRPHGYEQGWYFNAYPPVFSGPDLQQGIMLVEMVQQSAILVPYLTDDGGESWALTSGVSVDMVGPLVYDVVGARTGWVLDSAQGGRLQTIVDGKPDRVLIPDRPLAGALQIDFVDPNWGWALLPEGNGTALWRTSDGGRTWEPMAAHRR